MLLFKICLFDLSLKDRSENKNSLSAILGALRMMNGIGCDGAVY